MKEAFTERFGRLNEDDPQYIAKVNRTRAFMLYREVAARVRKTGKKSLEQPLKNYLEQLTSENLERMSFDGKWHELNEILKPILSELENIRKQAILILPHEELEEPPKEEQTEEKPGIEERREGIEEIIAPGGIYPGGPGGGEPPDPEALRAPNENGLPVKPEKVADSDATAGTKGRGGEPDDRNYPKGSEVFEDSFSSKDRRKLGQKTKRTN